MFGGIVELEELLKNCKTERVILKNMLKTYDIEQGGRIIARFERFKYPKNFDFREGDSLIQEGFKIAYGSCVKNQQKIYKSVLQSLFHLFSDQIKEKVDGLDLKTTISSVAFEYFSNFEVYNINEISFSKKLAFVLYNDNLMSVRQKELFTQFFEDKNFVKKTNYIFNTLYDNAVNWGSNGDASQPIHVAYRLKQPLLIGIEDCGNGFDYGGQESNGGTSRGFDYGGHGLNSIRKMKGVNLKHHNGGRIAIVQFSDII
jgi:hypothetical protein